MLGNFACFFFTSADFFQNQHFQKILSGISSVSNILDQDQAGLLVGPDLAPNCLQRLSADDTSKQKSTYALSFADKHAQRFSEARNT